MNSAMSVEIDMEQCNGCGICVEICPLDCLRMDDNEIAFMKYDECWYCGSCTLECPKDAIILRLPYLVR
ncbi:ferredoxin family protein [Desulfobacterales bacterium HSG17]|nr:ferredoxin family protein [Desulfobacterales bacterium HSG17]